MGFTFSAKSTPFDLSSLFLVPIIKSQTHQRQTCAWRKKDIRTSVSPTTFHQGHLHCTFTVSQPKESYSMFQPFLTAKGSSRRHIFCKWKFTDNIFTFPINLSPLNCTLFKHRSKTAYLVSLPHIIQHSGNLILFIMLVNHVWTLYNFAIKDYLWSQYILPLHLKRWHTLVSETISSHKWPPEIV